MSDRQIKLAMVAVVLFSTATSALYAADTPHPLHYINTAFENASPLWWEVDTEGVIHVHLVYDHEREAPNRANGHWNFRIEAEPGADLTILLGPFANIYNGKLGTAVREPATTFVSDDGRHWRAVKMEYVEPDRRRLKVNLRGPSLYVARLQPYRISDLEKLKTDIAGGLQERYAIPACIHELNADWIDGLDDYPTAANWKKYGEQLSVVFRKYFQR